MKARRSSYQNHTNMRTRRQINTISCYHVVVVVGVVVFSITEFIILVPHFDHQGLQLGSSLGCVIRSAVDLSGKP